MERSLRHAHPPEPPYRQPGTQRHHDTRRRDRRSPEVLGTREVALFQLVHQCPLVDHGRGGGRVLAEFGCSVRSGCRRVSNAGRPIPVCWGTNTPVLFSRQGAGAPDRDGRAKGPGAVFAGIVVRSSENLLNSSRDRTSATIPANRTSGPPQQFPRTEPERVRGAEPLVAGRQNFPCADGTTPGRAGGGTCGPMIGLPPPAIGATFSRST